MASGTAKAFIFSSSNWQPMRATSSRRRLTEDFSYKLSDRRAKANIREIDNALAALSSIRGVRFNYKNSETHENSDETIGVIAQEVQSVLPELVKSDSAGLLRVDYSALTGYLVQVNKELHDEVNSLWSAVYIAVILAFLSMIVSLLLVLAMFKQTGSAALK